MIIEWYDSTSSIKPDELDKTSSKKVVYLRCNIEEVKETIDDSETSESTENIFYKYKEAKIPKEDYEKYKNEITKELEIVTLKEKNEKLENDITDLQVAIAEMYETVSATTSV